MIVADCRRLELNVSWDATQLSFFLTFTYLPSFVLVTKEWYVRYTPSWADVFAYDVFFRSKTNVFYFGQAQTVGLTVFGIVGGIIMRFTQRYKVRIVFPATTHMCPQPSRSPSSSSVSASVCCESHVISRRLTLPRILSHGRPVPPAA